MRNRVKYDIMRAAKRIIPSILCLIMLAGCGDFFGGILEDEPEPTSPVKVNWNTPPVPIDAGYAFTEENYPRVDGSTATIPLIEAVESAILRKPRSEITVNVSKTSGAYIALARDEADILFVYDGGEETRALVSAAITGTGPASSSDFADGETLDFDERFETVSIGKDALVFLVNSENPIENLTTTQVRAIFSGEYTNWSQLGGSDEPIKAYQRGAGAGSQALMDALVMRGLPMGNPAMIKVIGDMGGLIDAVADFAGGPTGIGYNVFFYVTEMNKNDYIKILSIDGVEPTYETIQSGEYPFVSDFYSVIRRSEPMDSPARALHEWMLTPEAQNLMAAESYVALYADSGAATPHVDGNFSMYPEGEAPVYLEGVNPYIFEPSPDYGELYFYLGGIRIDEMAAPRFYGICDAKGNIITEPIYSVPTLLTDSAGNKAYCCFRADKERGSQTIDTGSWEYERTINPALLFATDGSWVMEFDGAEFFYGFTGASDVIMNADYLAVQRDGRWGAVNLRGETVIDFTRDSFEGMYPNPNTGGEYYYLGVTANRFLRGNPEDRNGMSNLYDAQLNLIATGIRGMPTYMVGSYIVTDVWNNDGTITVYTYTLDGEPIAKWDARGGEVISAATTFGEYVMLNGRNRTIICDERLNVLYGLELVYDEEREAHSHPMVGPGVLYRLDELASFYRTYLPDGTRLVTWYDPEMYE